jgi:Superfamily I DNA and RNA helicases and helicase subunits
MKNEASEYFDILLLLCQSEEIDLSVRYKQLRDLLERVCSDQMQNESLQITDLSARLNFVAIKTGLTIIEQNRLHTFRLTSNAILNRKAEPEREKLLRDIKTISFFVRKIYAEDIPPTLYRLLPRADATYIADKPGAKYTERMRVSFQYADQEYLYVIAFDTISDDYLRVRYNVPKVNEEFADTCESLWRYAQLNLLEVTEDEKGILTPGIIVLEPDYLLDISSLAECYKDYGNHPANYQLNKLQLPENTRALLLGNIANLFLDEWIHSADNVDYKQCMQKVFRKYALELAACTDLHDPEKEKEFFRDCKLHFDHIRETVQETFKMAGYALDKKNAVLEPSYICEALGLQGRLDYMQQDASSIIEMKSGRADEYAIRNKVSPKENHKVQMLLYQAILQYTLGKKHQEINAYLFYTRYPLLYPARSSWAMVRRAINLRNRIVADEFSIQFRNNIHYTGSRIKEMNATVLNERGLSGYFWTNYLKPSIDRTQQKIEKLSPIEKTYFYALYTFIAKEQYTAKSGSADYDGRRGAAALWLSTFMEKCESGEILYNLRIKENRATDEHKAHVILSKQGTFLPEKDLFGALPNFRQGDAVVLYERNAETDNVTNRMVFKGNIEYTTEGEVCVRLRATQHNPSVLPPESLYAIEHDFMDTTFRNMFTGLGAFLSANPQRRELLLGLRSPEFHTTIDSHCADSQNDFERICLKAAAAKDYFLLIGPPGTGKTSQALRRMVEMFHSEEDTQILLLAYTNRAVDEICKALTSIEPQVNFIRVGNELSCDSCYHAYLLENVLKECTRRNEVRNKISQCRIFVGTVATLSNKLELFKLKKFDVAIIDEATQILEPQLVGLLSACDETGKNAVGKFILIGDHKQLPAVVLQSSEQTEIYDATLRSVGITNLKDSLFERLYRSLKLMNDDELFNRSVDMLSKQGRMHPSVAYFSNQSFYHGKLQSLGLPHQQDTGCLKLNLENAIDITSRVLFIPSIRETNKCLGKTNFYEAKLTAELILQIYQQDTEGFNPYTSIGVITPYRTQIALIKQEIAKLSIEPLTRIMVDTVERFQGSERDIIIYSFCVNYLYQLQFLSNTIEEEDCLIDRKLNVALTRARKQMYIIGVPELLDQNNIYSKLIHRQE